MDAKAEQIIEKIKLEDHPWVKQMRWAGFNGGIHRTILADGDIGLVATECDGTEHIYSESAEQRIEEFKRKNRRRR